MTDKELLELAAKAAGIEYDADKSKPHPDTGNFWGLWLVIDGEPSEYTRRRWNPLKDDGDALRLAVQLEINLQHETLMESDFHPSINCGRYGVEHDFTWAEEPKGSNPGASTRRAIVRAAAEIGRAA